jgi:hypothetical protein
LEAERGYDPQAAPVFGVRIRVGYYGRFRGRVDYLDEQGTRKMAQ